MYCFKKNATLTCLYVLIYLQLDDYPPYYDKVSDIFETHININLRCSHVYINRIGQTDLITWVSKNAWEILLSEFLYAEIIIVCPRTIICNKCEQTNIRGDILNDGENVDDQEIFRFTESYFKISPTNIDGYTKIYY